MPFNYVSGRSNARYEPIEKKRDGRQLYRVLEPIIYRTDLKGEMFIIFVAEGFVTDLASIPSLPFMPKPGGSLWDDAAIVHDQACLDARANLITRVQADAIFYYALRDRGCNVITSTVFWAAVRAGHLVGMGK